MPYFLGSGAIILLVLVGFTTRSAAGVEGKWAGVLESPGSIGALRLYITPGPGFADSRFITDVYGQETASTIRELKATGNDVAFKSELSGAVADFVGRINSDEMAGSFSVAVDGRTASGKWRVRRFDYSTLPKPVPPTGSGGPIALPLPVGKYQIGRRSFYWTNNARQVYAQLWYPAARKPKAVDAVYIEHLDDKPELAMLRGLRTHAKLAVPLAGSKTPFPVIVFAPGLGSSIARYAAIIENLVSHGYSVVAVNPAGDAGEFRLADGTLLRYNSEVWNRPVSATWTAEKRKTFFDERRHGWASDMSFALDQLRKTFPGELDLEDAGALGHSFGGQAVSIACANDRRFKACANLDGLAQGAAFLPNSKGELLKQPFLFFSKGPVASDYELALMGLTRTEYDARDRKRMLELWRPSLKARLEALPQGSYFAVARGATHQTFSDGPLLQTDQPREILADRRRLAADINRRILAFFEKFLRKKNVTLLEPDVNVVVEFLKERVR